MFQKMEYEKLQKVYSIWLLPLADEKLGNTVRQISLKEKIILGENNDHASLPVEYYDMMELVVASMNGDYMPKAKPTVLELLWLVSTLNLDAGQKKQYLKEVFNMDVTEKMDEEIQSLYDQFRAYYGAKQFKQMWDETSRREFARAEALGAKKTRKEMVEILLKKGFSMKWIMDIYDLSEQQMLETLGRNKFNKYKV